MVDKDFAWRLAQELVRIDSSDPGAYEGEIERYIKARVEERMAQLSHPFLDAVQIEELREVLAPAPASTLAVSSAPLPLMANVEPSPSVIPPPQLLLP